MGDWLGTGNDRTMAQKITVRFVKARAFARKLKLKSDAEWRAFCKGEMPRLGRLPADIPASPSRTYADKGWKGMGDWLGTGNIAPLSQGIPSIPSGAGICPQTQAQEQS